MCFSSESASQNLHVQIKGSTKKETQIINSINYLKKHKNYLSVKSETDTLQKKLHKVGYIENDYSVEKKNDSTYMVSFILKQKYDKIKVYYKNSYLKKELLPLDNTDKGGDYFELKLKETEQQLNSINTKHIQLGFPFSKLKLSNIKINDNNILETHLIIDGGDEKRTIDDIIIKGYNKFPKSYLRHFLKIKQEQIFDIAKINKKTEFLNDLKFATKIKPAEILFSKDSSSLYLYIEKTQSNSFDGFLGFGTNEESNKLQFDGYINLNLINNLNYGEEFKLKYKSDENDQTTFETNLTLPYLFNSPIGIDLQLNIFRKDSTFSTTSQYAKLHYQVNPKQKIYAGISNSISSNLLSKETTTQIHDYEKKYYSLAYEYSKPQNDDLLFPLNTFIKLESNFGKKESKTANENQTQISFSIIKIFNINNVNSFFLKMTGANLNSNSFFENELFRFGGINSIRGFEENSILASQFGVLNTEYRYRLSNTIFIHSIIDASYFNNKPVKNKEKLFGYGLGIGILTKSGLLKINYANGKSENQRFKLSNSKIHISLKALF